MCCRIGRLYTLQCSEVGCIRCQNVVKRLKVRCFHLLCCMVDGDFMLPIMLVRFAASSCFGLHLYFLARRNSSSSRVWVVGFMMSDALVPTSHRVPLRHGILLYPHCRREYPPRVVLRPSIVGYKIARPRLREMILYMGQDGFSHRRSTNIPKAYD